VHHDESRRVRQDEPLGEVNQVRRLERIDATIDNGVSLQVLGEGPPAVELRVLSATSYASTFFSNRLTTAGTCSARTPALEITTTIATAIAATARVR
jgi:hypothetical protein